MKIKHQGYKQDTVAAVLMLHENSKIPRVHEFKTREAAEKMYSQFATPKIIMGEIEVMLLYKKNSRTAIFVKRVKKYRERQEEYGDVREPSGK